MRNARLICVAVCIVHRDTVCARILISQTRDSRDAGAIPAGIDMNTAQFQSLLHDVALLEARAAGVRATECYHNVLVRDRPVTLALTLP